MGFDPVSLGIMASVAGAGMSMAGSGMSAGSAAKNGAKQAQARNDILNSQNAKLDGFNAINRGTVDQNVAGYSPDAQAAKQAMVTGRRVGDANAAVDSATAGAGGPTVMGSSSPAVAADYASRMKTSLDTSRATATAGAGLKGYDDTFNENKWGDQQAARNIDTENGFARAQSGLTPALQDFAQFQAYRPPSMAGPIVSGIGSVLSSYGGNSLGAAGSAAAGAAKAGANIFSTAGNAAGVTPTAFGFGRNV